MEKASRKWPDQPKGLAYHSQYIPEKPQEEYREECSEHIEIVVNKSRQHINKTKAVRSKFETDLDDEFLQLFAN
jgi:hypothetical protein